MEITEAKIIELLQGIKPEAEIDVQTALFSDGLFDSFDMMLMISEFEEAFGVSIPGEDILPENFDNVSLLKQTLENCQDD